MAEMFSGDWTVEVLWGGSWIEFLTEGSSRRFIIEGALTGNGVYSYNFGPIGPPPLGVRTEMVHQDRIVCWGCLRLAVGHEQKRSSAAYTLQGGLVVDITSVNWIPIPIFVGSIDSATLRCRNVDRQLNPWFPRIRTTSRSPRM